jgi:hypothetical protein
MVDKAYSAANHQNMILPLKLRRPQIHSNHELGIVLQRLLPVDHCLLHGSHILHRSSLRRSWLYDQVTVQHRNRAAFLFFVIYRVV